MSNDKLFVGQKRKWNDGHPYKKVPFEIIHVGINSAFYRYDDETESSNYINYVLEGSTEIKPEPKRTKLCAYEFPEVGEVKFFREIPMELLLEKWTKKNLKVIEGELFVVEE